MINIRSITTQKVFFGVLMAAVLIGSPSTWINAASTKQKINTNIYGVAIKGYDTVAYFTEGRAVKGISKFSYNWNDAKWYFESAKNRDLFAADPEQYAPQYGGY